jgi:SWI/SNF-related matrix-associated actin-dependent regulator of chromatin subfamily A member 5
MKCRWCPSLRVYSFHGGKEERERLKAAVFTHGSFDVCVTTYEMLVTEEFYFTRHFMWKYVILDEGISFISHFTLFFFFCDKHLSREP